MVKLAAEQVDATAQTNLASLYSNGQGVAKNEVEALKWLKLAAEQGLPEAKEALKELEK